MNFVKRPTREPGLRPRRTKLEISGRQVNGSPALMAPTNTVWHCLPFAEGGHYDNCFIPRTSSHYEEGRLIFNGDFGPAPDKGRAAKAKKQKS